MTVGFNDGGDDGIADGERDGVDDGNAEGVCDGNEDGGRVGAAVGMLVGAPSTVQQMAICQSSYSVFTLFQDIEMNKSTTNRIGTIGGVQIVHTAVIIVGHRPLICIPECVSVVDDKRDFVRIL